MEDYVYHEVENLGDSDDQNKAPSIVETSLPVSAVLDSDKYEAMANAKIEDTKLGKLRPIYDWKTSNKSFLELYRDLVNLKVKNNKFFLVIYDQSLIGIDPYNKALPLTVKLRIIAECKRNPWYFLREVCRIPADGLPVEEGGGVAFQIDRTSLAMWYLFLHHIDQYVCKPRQTGKTQGALSIMTYAFTLGAKSATILFSNKDAENNKMNLYRMKCQRDMLPSYMQMRLSVGFDGSMQKEKNSVTTFQNPVNNNSIKLLPRANSKDSAMSCGRGATAPIFYGDEVDFSPYFNTILESAAYAYSTASQNAIKYKSMAGRIFTSTPGDLDSRDGENIMQWISHMFVWNDQMLDWPLDRLKSESVRVIGAARRNGIIYVEHSWRQLKKTESWYETQCRLVEYKPEVVQREIDLKRMHGSSQSPFERQDILYIQRHMRTAPIGEMDLSKSLNPFKFYKKMKKRIPYFICIDPSEGLALDNNAVEILHPATMEVVAEMKNPYITQTDLGDMIIQFMDLFCPNALLVIENNKGRELINYMLRTKYAHRVWYDNQKMMDIQESVRTDGKEVRAAMERRAYGVNTNGSSRPIMMSILERLMHEEKHKIYSPYVVNDICALIRKPGSGKIEASPGMHDDNVLAFLLGHYVRYNAKNLDEFEIFDGMYEDEDEMDGYRTKPKVLTKEQQEEENFKKLRELYPSLPPELRELMQPSLFGPQAMRTRTVQQSKAKMEADKNLQIQASELLENEAYDYAAQAAALSKMRDRSLSSSMGYDPDLAEAAEQLQGQGMDDYDYDRFASQMLDLNGLEGQNSQPFNIDDYID